MSLALSCVLYWFIEQAIDRKTEAFIEARDTQARVLFEEENEDRAKEMLDNTFGVRTILENHLLSVDEPLEFLTLVDDTIPRITGAPTEVKSISKEGGEDTGGAEKTSPHVRVVLSAEGDWSNLYHLLLLIEHLPYAISLDRAILTLSTTGSDYDWEANIFLTGGVKE